jgi:hypothetical protein
MVMGSSVWLIVLRETAFAGWLLIYRAVDGALGAENRASIASFIET